MTIAAKMIADSISPQRIRLATLQLRYPKFIHGEFMTHRVFSRNASSSRAIPVERMIQDVMDDPVLPVFWGKNQPGMQAKEECRARLVERVSGMPGFTTYDGISRKGAWLKARNQAVEMARDYAAAGYHKQIVNRLLEPWCHINVVVTSTDWANFFALRCHPDAQPEMRMLAEAIRAAMEAGKPTLLQPGEWHLPYFTQAELDAYRFMERLDDAIKISVARCARVSYLTHEGKESSIEDDLKLHDHLVGSVPPHASPAEHQATPDEPWFGDAENGWKQDRWHGNFRGWVQYRKTLPNESVEDG